MTDTMAHIFDQAPAVVRVDTFKADPASRDLLLPQILATHEALRGIPGFISDQIIERFDDSGQMVVMTLVAWENSAAATAAGPVVGAFHQHRGFDPAQFLEHNGISIERAQFETITQAGLTS